MRNAANMEGIKHAHKYTTGVGGACCARHGCVVPGCIVDFYKGERYVSSLYPIDYGEFNVQILRMPTPYIWLRCIDQAPFINGASIDHAPFMNVIGIDQTPSMNVMGIDQAPFMYVIGIDQASFMNGVDIDQTSFMSSMVNMAVPIHCHFIDIP